MTWQRCAQWCDTEDVGGHLPSAPLLSLAAACAVPVLYAVWVRPWMLTWGATEEEVAGTYPGDEIIPEPGSGATMATTLPSPPGRVWRWLAQMGGDRGGWYSWDWLDNDAKPSADRIVPEWQSLEESWHSILEFELRSVEHFATRATARARVSAWMEDYNQNRRHYALGMMSPVSYEQALQARKAA